MKTAISIRITNKNLFWSITNESKILISKSLGSYKLKKKALRSPIFLKKVVEDIKTSLESHSIGCASLTYRSSGSLKLYRFCLRSLFSDEIKPSFLTFNIGVPHNGCRRPAVRRL
jgi:ribosomal protein S11